MLVLNPRRVTFAGEAWGEVVSVVVDRQAVKLVESFGDAGPHCVLVDAVEQRVAVTVVQQLARGEVPDVPRPGDAGELVFAYAAAGGSGRKVRVAVSAVVIGVSHGVGLKQGATRTVTFRGVSSDGGAGDPVSVSEDATGD
ncbi:MAG: hypothetical protein EA378_05690 [Phycisphaerales bacterium]|nr:MAG: hypothetical protein EA378_05690 [Phycisphaerales bacterium]